MDINKGSDIKIKAKKEVTILTKETRSQPQSRRGSADPKFLTNSQVFFSIVI